jgi:hypothetical protein
MRVAVIIPTTDGPAPILKLTRLAQAPRSVLRTQDDYRPLPPSSRYHAFIQAGGPLAEWIGLGDGQFELRLGAPVETGRSWELPAALAHWVQSAGHRLDPEAAELVVWATGALDNDLALLGQDYHLPTKLERSAALLQYWLDRGVPVLVLLPQEVPRSASPMGPLVSVRQVRDLAEAIAAMRSAMPAIGPVTSPAPSVRRRRILLAGTAALVLSAVVWLSAGLRPTGTANDLAVIDAAISAAPATAEEEARSAPLELATAAPAPDPASAQPSEPRQRSQPDAPSPADVSTPVVAAAELVFPRLVLAQAPEGSSCRSVLFGEMAPARADRIAEDGVFHAVVDGELCGLGFHLPQSGTEAADIMLPSALADLILPSDRQVRFSLAPGQDRHFRLRTGLPARIEVDVGMTRSGRDPVPFRVIIETRR